MFSINRVANRRRVGTVSGENVTDEDVLGLFDTPVYSVCCQVTKRRSEREHVSVFFFLEPEEIIFWSEALSLSNCFWFVWLVWLVSCTRVGAH